jgi:hypothetical protein
MSHSSFAVKAIASTARSSSRSPLAAYVTIGQVSSCSSRSMPSRSQAGPSS